MEEKSLEEEFRDLYNAHIEEIMEEINKASAALKKAVALSEKYGVPFNSSIYWVSNNYIPKSYTESKFKGLEAEVLEEIAQVYNEYGVSQGWEHSEFCY